MRVEIKINIDLETNDKLFSEVKKLQTNKSDFINELLIKYFEEVKSK